MDQVVVKSDDYNSKEGDCSTNYLKNTFCQAISLA